jgi:hypothetical protein
VGVLVARLGAGGLAPGDSEPEDTIARVDAMKDAGVYKRVERAVNRDTVGSYGPQALPDIGRVQGGCGVKKGGEHPDPRHRDPQGAFLQDGTGPQFFGISAPGHG